MSQNTVNHIRVAIDANGVATLTMDWPGAVNLMDADFLPSITAIVDRLGADDVKGAIIRSATKTFFAGADLARFAEAQQESAAAIFAEVEAMKAQLRRLEKLGKPVVALIEGAALGGGLEIALACHHRVAVDSRHTKLGLPEVQLGLLPAGGGVTRLVRMLGLQAALPLMIEAK